MWVRRRPEKAAASSAARSVACGRRSATAKAKRRDRLPAERPSRRTLYPGRLLESNSLLDAARLSRFTLTRPLPEGEGFLRRSDRKGGLHCLAEPSGTHLPNLFCPLPARSPFDPRGCDAADEGSLGEKEQYYDRQREQHGGRHQQVGLARIGADELLETVGQRKPQRIV